MVNVLRLIPVVLLFFSQAFSQYSSAGTSAFPFLKMDNNARTLAMGGASAGIANGLYGASINPASTGFITGTQAMAGYQSLILDAWAGPAGYAASTKKFGVFSSNVMYVSHGYLDSSEALDENGISTGESWHVFSLVGSIGWSKILFDNFSAGISCKGIYHPIRSSADYYVSASGMAFDAGCMYTEKNSRFIIGAAIQNAGFMISNYSEDSPELSLPLSFTIGFSYVPMYLQSLRLACDLQQANDDYLNYKPGFEWAVYKKNLFVRGGYGFSEKDLEHIIKKMKNESTGTYYKSNASGLSLGLGIVTDINGINTSVDVAYINRTEDLGSSLGLSILVEY
jgi:hypothetical protein